MRRLTAVLFASCALVACGNDDGGGEPAASEAPACDELYADGSVIEAGRQSEPCMGADGDPVFVPAFSQACADGRKLVWNDRGWWFEGEAFNPDSRGEPPSSAASECG